MLTVFEVHFAPGSNPDTLLSEEVKRETHAQMMTLEEAKKVGFGGLPEAEAGKTVRLVAVNHGEAKWIQRVLETSSAVASFRMHGID